MNFLTMQQELAGTLRAYDETISTDATQLKRWLNMAQQNITSRQNWPFMLAHETLQTVIDVTTGTISINSGSTTVTFTSGPTLSATDWFIKFQGDSSWYRIASHTAGATTATLTIGYGGTSNLSAATYTLRKLFYVTATPMDSILDVKKTATGRFVESANSRDVDVFLPLYWDSGAVYKYISSVPDSTGAVRISFLYSPSTVENMQVRGIKKLADMSADSDTSIIPARWHEAIVNLAAIRGFRSLDDSRAKDLLLETERIIQSMAEVYDADLGRLRVTRSLNTGILEGPAYILPPQYGVNQA